MITHSQEKTCALDDQMLPYVTRIARYVRRHLAPQMDLDDLISFGVAGYLETLSCFDASRGTPLARFAYGRTYGAMVDGVRKWSVANHAHAVSMRRKRRAESRGETCRKPRIQLSSLDTPLGSTSEPHCCLPSQEMGGVQSSSERKMEQEDLLRRIARISTTLPMTQRVLLELLYGQEMNMGEVAEVMGYSKSWVCRTHQKALLTLRARVRGALGVSC